MKNILISCLMLSFVSLAHADTFPQTDSFLFVEIPNLEEILDRSEGEATVEGREVLQSARRMIKNNEIVLGSCWDYIDAIFMKAGFPQNRRMTIFKSKLQGPYVDEVLIEPGDWLYFMNHSYNNVEHSSVFVAWSDFATKQAVMISYAGGNQARPARYKIYDLSSVYNIMRAR